MTTRLSIAEAVHASPNHPLDAALHASIYGPDGDKWLSAWTYASPESRRELEHDRLMRFYPQLGVSVRHFSVTDSYGRAQYPMAAIAERLNIVARSKPFQTAYRQEIHASVWRVVSEVFARGKPQDIRALYSALEACRL